MKLQQEISIESGRKYLGRTIDVLIDEKVATEDNEAQSVYSSERPACDLIFDFRRDPAKAKRRRENPASPVLKGRILERRDEFIGRTQGDAPEIDGVVYVTAEGVKIGDFCKVKITDTLEYDLIGEIA
ncbi:MAG: TRAM domain-containing protein [Candidatus Omnitrophica bacterium]|nr:TRAM domain-containing protein [Candidatus Omnitrophota bacterium]